ncbi:MAG: hypothetical protein ACRDZ0_10470 [Acidimicrobiales bacterium]
MKIRSFMIAVVLAAVALAGALPGAPAGAHDGDGIITMEAAHPAGTSIHFIVRVTWENDGHPAADAVVTATAVGGDGTQLTPVTLAPVDDGRYANAIDFGSSGAWAVRFTSIDPTGAAEVDQTVEAPPATPADDPAAASGDSGEGGFAPADDDTGASGGAAASDGGDSGMPIWLVGAAAVVVFGGGFLALRTVRRYRSEAAAEEAQFEELEAVRTAGKASEMSGGTAAGPKAET